MTVAFMTVSAGTTQNPSGVADSLSPAARSAVVTQSNQLFGTLMSPFCPGLTLANCPSIYAETLRVSVRGRLAAGEEPDQVVESLVAAFGEGMRGAPRARGLGLALWTLPFIALVGGGTGVTWWIRRRRARPASQLASGVSRLPAPAGTPEELGRLETALRDYQD